MRNDENSRLRKVVRYAQQSNPIQRFANDYKEYAEENKKEVQRKC